MNEVWFSATGVSFGTKLLILFATVPGTGMLQSSDWLYRCDVQTRPYHVREHNPKIFVIQLNVQVDQLSDNEDQQTSFLAFFGPRGRDCQMSLSGNDKTDHQCESPALWQSAYRYSLGYMGRLNVGCQTVWTKMEDRQNNRPRHRRIRHLHRLIFSYFHLSAQCTNLVA